MTALSAVILSFFLHPYYNGKWKGALPHISDILPDKIYFPLILESVLSGFFCTGWELRLCIL